MRTLALQLAFAVGLPSAAMGSTLPLEVEELRMQAAEWVDDFEAGELNDGDQPFEPLHWVGPRTPAKIAPFPPCGTDGFVLDGKAVFIGSLACAGGLGTLYLPGGNAGDATLRAAYAIPAEFRDLDSFGVGFLNENNTEASWLLVTRIDALGGVFAELFADPGFLGRSLLDAVLLPTPEVGDEVTFELSLAVEERPGLGTVRVPKGVVRVCGGARCEEVRLECEPPPAPSPLGCITGSLDEGTISISAVSTSGLLSVRNGGIDGQVVEAESFSLSFDAEDDFESEDGLPFFLAPLPGVCAEASAFARIDGALRLDGSNRQCPFTSNVTQLFSLPLAANTAGDQRFDVRYRFKVPDPCEFYGTTIGAGIATIDPADPDPYTSTVPPLFFFDFASVGVIRSPDPDDPLALPDTLRVVLQSESMAPFGGPDIPTIASATISVDPDDDPALDGVTHIQFELSAVAGLPSGRFRLCTAGACAPEFIDLSARANTAFPSELVCGVPAAQYDPPIDIPALGIFAAEGRFQSGAPLAPQLTVSAVPEPSAVFVSLSALFTLLVVAWRFAEETQRDLRTSTPPQLTTRPAPPAAQTPARVRCAPAPGAAAARPPQRRRAAAAGLLRSALHLGARPGWRGDGP